LIGTEGFSVSEKRKLKRFLDSSAAVADVLKTGDPICLNGLEALAPSKGATRPELAKITLIPLISRSEGLGVLCLASPTLDYCETKEALSLAQAIASQLAVALENTRRYEDARFQAERDSLTGLLNHRGISKRLEQEVARCERSGAVLGLVMIDVDNFKLFNDAYGHAVGDRVLQGLADVMTALLRRSDAIGRYGGDEFIAVLPDSDIEATVALAERMREALENTPLFTDGDRKVPIKMSYGVATFPDDGKSPGDLLAAADVNLYRSKQRGGDLITASVNDDEFRPASIGAFSVLDGLVTSVDHKDHYTRQHSEDVTVHAVTIASRMGLSIETQRTLRVAALLHDIGKIGIPDHVLRKPAELNDDEQEIIKNHVMLGELIIHGIPGQEEVVGAVGSHHERFDGKGYPRGLSGESIPLLGRILAAADAYSAMTTDRPYGKGLPPEEAKAELRRIAGTQLDPEITVVLLEYLEDRETGGETDLAVSAARQV
jgi:diguanylate cyclase (GGDEF)-like protein/putative nucleotidyltransferase with HDIG domain